MSLVVNCQPYRNLSYTHLGIILRGSVIMLMLPLLTSHQSTNSLIMMQQVQSLILKKFHTLWS